MALFFYEKRYLNKIKAFHSLNKNEKDKYKTFSQIKILLKFQQE